MRVAIIGGSGFVGTKLIKTLKLRSGFEIINIDKQMSTDFPEITHLGNVLDGQILERLLKGIDVVVLLAAEHRDDVTPVSLYYDVNVQGMKNTLKAMEKNRVKHIVFTSSVAVYGLNKINSDELSAIAPFNHYGTSKWQAEEVLKEWSATRPDWNIQIVRPTVIFGEGNRGNVYNLLKQISSGKFMMVGKGDNRKSMSYIGNIVAFIDFLIQENESCYEVYNYVDKPDFTTNDLVYHTGVVLQIKIPMFHIPYALGMLGGYGFDVLAFMTRKKLTISSVRVKKFCAETQYDSSKMMQSGFVPPYRIEEGLKRMLKAEFGNK